MGWIPTRTRAACRRVWAFSSLNMTTNSSNNKSAKSQNSLAENFLTLDVCILAIFAFLYTSHERAKTSFNFNYGHRFTRKTRFFDVMEFYQQKRETKIRARAARFVLRHNENKVRRRSFRIHCDRAQTRGRRHFCWLRSMLWLRYFYARFHLRPHPFTHLISLKGMQKGTVWIIDWRILLSFRIDISLLAGLQST